MSTIQPLKNKEDIRVLGAWLGRKSIRDEALFILGISSGLRIKDLLGLTFGDVVESNKGKLILRDRIQITESKTKKKKDFPINKSSTKILREYIQSVGEYTLSEPLFFSRKKSDKGTRKPISRQQARDLLKLGGEEIGLKQIVSTHTLRKTFAYHQYMNGFDIGLLMDLLNHSSQKTTLRYIGIEKEARDNAYLNLEWWGEMKDGFLFEEFEQVKKEYEFSKKHERGHFIVSKQNMDIILSSLDFILAHQVIENRSKNGKRKRARKWALFFRKDLIWKNIENM